MIDEATQSPVKLCAERRSGQLKLALILLVPQEVGGLDQTERRLVAVVRKCLMISEITADRLQIDIVRHLVIGDGGRIPRFQPRLRIGRLTANHIPERREVCIWSRRQPSRVAVSIVYAVFRIHDSIVVRVVDEIVDRR